MSNLQNEKLLERLRDAYDAWIGDWDIQDKIAEDRLDTDHPYFCCDDGDNEGLLDDCLEDVYFDIEEVFLSREIPCFDIDELYGCI